MRGISGSALSGAAHIGHAASRVVTNGTRSGILNRTWAPRMWSTGRVLGKSDFVVARSDLFNEDVCLPGVP